MTYYHNLQMRFPANNVVPGMRLSVRGTTYTLGQPTPKTLQPSALPIGVVMNGYTEQFSLLHHNQIVGAAWFYFYGAFGGEMRAVLDEVELAATASAESNIETLVNQAAVLSS